MAGTKILTLERNGTAENIPSSKFAIPNIIYVSVSSGKTTRIQVSLESLLYSILSVYTDFWFTVFLIYRTSIVPPHYLWNMLINVNQNSWNF